MMVCAMAAFTRILVVEDEPVFRSIVVRNLRARGCEVEEADTTAAALASLQSTLPDLILLDINLPDRSGWDVLRHLQSRGQHSTDSDRLGGAREPGAPRRVQAARLPAEAVPPGGAASRSSRPATPRKSRRSREEGWLAPALPATALRDRRMPSVPGLSQVLTACELLPTSHMSSVSVSIASSERDAELIALEPGSRRRERRSDGLRTARADAGLAVHRERAR